MSFPIHARLRRLAAPATPASVFVGLLALAAWLDARSTVVAEPAERWQLPASAPTRRQVPRDTGARPSEGGQDPAKGQDAPRPRWRPLEGNYPASLTAAIVALAPFIVITTAYAMFTRQVAHDAHASRTALSIIEALSTAAYAWGAFLGGDLVLRFPQRRLFFVAEGLFVLGCLLSAIAHREAMYAAGRVLSGFGTGVLLVAALPPVIQRFPSGKLPITVVAINIGFFGAVCIGPLLGGWVAAGHDWRWFYGVLGAIALANTALAVLTLPVQAPIKPDQRLDLTGILLGLVAVALPFWGAGELVGHGFASPYFAAPMFVGLVCFIVLLLVEYHQKDPLSPVKPMWTTQSVVGTLIAMIGGGVFIAFLELGEEFHMRVAHQTPLQTGLLFWPLALAVLISAGVFGAILRTRWIPLLVLAGMIGIMGGGAMLLFLSSGSAALTLGASALLGLGAGATVSPGLYLAGFPLPTQMIGRVFALVELVRSLADYIIAPVILQIAREASARELDGHGVHLALWITLWLTVFFTALGILLWVLGRGGLPRPDIDGWVARRNPAIDSTPLLARLRAGR